MQGDVPTVQGSCVQEYRLFRCEAPLLHQLTGFAPPRVRGDWSRMHPPAQAVVLVAFVAPLRLVDPLVGLLLVAAAGVVRDLAPGVLVPRRMPAQPAERL